MATGQKGGEEHKKILTGATRRQRRPLIPLSHCKSKNKPKNAPRQKEEASAEAVTNIPKGETQVMNDDTRNTPKPEQAAGGRRPSHSRRLTMLEPEEVRGLSPEDRQAWSAEAAQDDKDFSLLMDFFDTLYPLARKAFKAHRDETYFGIHKKGHQRRWDKLLTHLLSLPTYSDDPQWLARITRFHGELKMKQAQWEAERTDHGTKQPQAEAITGEVTPEQTTPSTGEQYVRGYLYEMTIEGEWISQNIDAGYFLICPRCHFLHLPRRAWHLGRTASAPVPADGCDVCAHVYDSAAIPGHICDLDKAIEEALDKLKDCRTERAALLHELWIKGSLSADTWVLSRLAENLVETQRLATGPRSE